MKKILLTTFIFVLAACSQDIWKESPSFESGGYKLIGEKGKLGFIYENSEVDQFSPNKVNKYMWHVWGSDMANKMLRVEAIKENTSEQIHLFEARLSGTPHNGADAVTPSSMALPKPGMWKLNAYVDDQLFGSVYVKVQDE
ncbi:DUF4871 domain-containing protein [Fictibacillus phosphorivorans]|uniref:DUF4871 domain-containing protein n=1 Tax=Fictibacillus phosphorivorans TaxID=1221500 RepID=UPI0012933880|nr:DUF4871 domain-containing protein [Fictibacillus phosphorivorans]MQR94483.1 DUF4871 domain-containing protein [Fictibacillus phosphorivorans]